MQRYIYQFLRILENLSVLSAFLPLNIVSSAA